MNQMPMKLPDPSTSYRIDNPEEFTRNMLRLFEEGGKVMSQHLGRPDSRMSPYSAASEASEAAQTVSDIARRYFESRAIVIDVG